MASQTVNEGAPARGTRPRNRRALIVAAATDLFYRVGYAGVSMSDIAAAVNVAPSALYRHFASKSELFVAAARDTLAPTLDYLQHCADVPRPQLLLDLARLLVARREVGVLWQREARLLSAEIHQEVRADLRRVAALLADRIGRDRPQLPAADADLLAWSALAAMSSVSFHQLQLPGARFESVLADVLDRILAADLPDPPAADGEPPPGGLQPRTRRAHVLREAARLFAAHGYAAVTVDDIGEAVGIAGPSLYNHFASKQELLMATLDRCNEWLWLELETALAAAVDEADALHRLLDSYVRLTTRHGDVVDVLISDIRELAEPDQHRARQSQHDYVTEWVELLRAVRPDLDAVAARIQVQAALMVVNDGAQTPHLARRPGFPAAVQAVVAGLLR
ncbi:TetR/AcrR family transcriptional regulator [Pseudonocardia sp. GCM10023141]|uniref:TetR/AcrR family transcriptional regulator n=1 Tax=Pseudonocardia sp. GCM10023141 TaxID=3252653 RepID=UPI0036182CE6